MRGFERENVRGRGKRGEGGEGEREHSRGGEEGGERYNIRGRGARKGEKEVPLGPPRYRGTV